VLPNKEQAMSGNQERHNKPEAPNHEEGAPKQALSGGGFEPAGSSEGGSAYGDDREDAEREAPAVPEGGFRADTQADSETPGAPDEKRTFASPDGQEGSRKAATETVTNTGEPRPVRNGGGVEGQPGDEADAATG